MKNDEQAPQKVLIVEDDIAIRTPLATKFKNEGFTVLQASDGKEGLAVALAETPDIILLDLIMPNVNGSTMLTNLRNANAWGQQVPVVVLTNQIEIDEATIKNRPAYYLPKAQSTMQTVVEKVRDVLSSTGA